MRKQYYEASLDRFFNENGTVRQNAFIHDQKNGKNNLLYPKPVQSDLFKLTKALKETTF